MWCLHIIPQAICAAFPWGHSFHGEKALSRNSLCHALNLQASRYICLSLLQGFASAIEMKRFLGEDEGVGDSEDGRDSPSGIIVETLLNIRTVSALTLEEQRFQDYERALAKSEGNLVKESLISGSLAGLGIGIQQWVNAVQFYWGGWLVSD